MKKLYLLFILFTTIVNAQEPFITTWFTYDENLTIEIPVVSDAGNNYTIDFGDGTILTNQSGPVSHTYNTPGTYTVLISGNFGRLDSTTLSEESANQFHSIEQWGDIQWTSMENAFSGCDNLNINAIDAPDLSQSTSLKNMFRQINNINQSLNNWDVSTITNMSYMFFNASYEGPLDNWDVSNVTDMSYMFHSTSWFNSSLNSWDVSNVTNMSHMLLQSSYNQPLDNWDVSNVTNMSNMFKASNFNQPINNWNVSNVTTMDSMFSASEFNQPLDNWDVSNVTDMNMMFSLGHFNQPIDNWNVSNVTTMQSMFSSASEFNQPLDNWDVSNVTNMNMMFNGATVFNQPLNNWNVSNVTDMNMMFRHTTLFNQPLNNWDVSNLIIYSMFEYASSFNQDISGWEFNTELQIVAVGYSALDSSNYDKLMLKLAQTETTFYNKRIFADWMTYCDSGVRDHLINQLEWTIMGDTLSEECLGNNITGNIIYDENANGCDTEDPLIGSFLVKADDGNYGFSTISSNGEYDLRVIDGTFDVELLNVPPYYTVTPPSSEIEFTGFGNNEELNFCLTANEAINDLNITLIPINEARPGFESHYKLITENIGTQTITGATASFTFNEAIQEFVSASQAPASEAVNQLTFDFSTILPLESKSIDITMQTFTPPTVNGDETINFVATVTPDTNDNTPTDNIYNLDQVVVNSFDPNDKRILQGEEIFMEQTEGYLDYVIRFQNTGTASAITVRIEDVLHENLDWTTFKPVASSHDYTIRITDGNQVEFTFNNINLPHEEADEEGSNGYVAYKIKVVEDITIGDVITGTASIFFDYNLPIVTNSADTKVVEPTSGINEHIASGLTVYPNPAKDILYLSAQDGLMIENIKIYSLQGSEIMNINGSAESVNIQDLSAGIYLLNIQTNQGISKHRLVKK